MNESSRELLIDKENLVGDEGREDDIESDRGEALLIGTVLGVLIELAVSRWANLNNDKRYL